MALDERDMDDKSAGMRNAPRRRVLFSGILVNDDGSSTFECSIRDVSPSGAKVRLGGSAPVPSELWLIEVREGRAFRCAIAWRRLPELGLAFLSVHDLKITATPEQRMLHGIWAERVAR